MVFGHFIINFQFDEFFEFSVFLYYYENDAFAYVIYIIYV